jgi:hypothetical protein
MHPAYVVVGLHVIANIRFNDDASGKAARVLGKLCTYLHW